MTDVAAPHDPHARWDDGAMRARLQRRYRSERLFRGLGLTAVLLSVAFLLFLLVSMASAGLTGFSQTRVALAINLPTAGLAIRPADLTGPEARQRLAHIDVGAAIAAAAVTQYGDGANRWFGLAAERDLRRRLLAAPSLLTRRVIMPLPVVSALDSAAKSNGAPEDRAIVARLRASGALTSAFDMSFLTGADATDPTAAGIWGALKGSLMTMLVTFCIAFPVGTLAALYLEEYAPRNRLTDAIEVTINNLAAVPSILFGLLALELFINRMGLCSGSPLVGGLALALMTMPVIVIAARNAIKAVPPSIRDAAYGIGASKVQTVFHHILPLALPGILTGTILGMARALGETAPLLLIGMRAFIGGVPRGFCDASTVLPMQVYLWSDEVDHGFIENTSTAIIVLLILLLSLNAAAIVLRNRFETRW
jgi:phosphate transport system permease protein